MMMIYLKRRVSSLADSLKSIYSSFNATKDDDDLLEKKSIIFCSLTEVTLSLHPGKETQITKDHFWRAQKHSQLKSYSTRRKMTMIYCKRRVSSFADSLKSLNAMSSRGLQNEIHGFLKFLEKVFSFCRIHLGTAMLDRELQDLIQWVSTKLEVSP